MKKLGQLLLDFGWIEEIQLQQALQTQRVVGGRIGSCLLEVGALDEPMLLRALAHQRSVPAARTSDLNNVPEEVYGLLPKRIALRCLAVPFRMLGSELYVALLQVDNLELHDEIAFATGKQVRVHIGNEVRLFTALHRYYGRELSDRFQLLEAYLDRPVATVPRRSGFGKHLSNEDSETSEDTAEFVPAGTFVGRNASEFPIPKGQQGKLLLDAEPDTSVSNFKGEVQSAGRADPGLVTEIHSPLPLSSVSRDTAEGRATETDPANTITTRFLRRFESSDEFRRALEDLDDREAMARLFVEYVRPHFRQLLLYKVLPEAVVGWIGAGDRIDSTRLSNTVIDVGKPSIFHDLRNGRGMHVGPLATLSAHRDVVAAFGGDAPAACLFVPVRLGGRLVTVLIGEPKEDVAEMAPEQQADLRSRAGEAAAALGDAFGNYLLRQRRKTS